MKGLTLPPAEGKGRRWTLIAEIVGGTVVPALVAGDPAVAVPGVRPGRRLPGAGADLQQLYAPIAVMWLASLAVLWAVLLRPDWARVRTIGRFLTDGLSLVLATILLRADAVVQLAPGVEATDKMVGVVRFINAQARIVVLIWLLASIWQISSIVSDRHRVQHRPLTAPVYVTT